MRPESMADIDNWSRIRNLLRGIYEVPKIDFNVLAQNVKDFNAIVVQSQPNAISVKMILESENKKKQLATLTYCQYTNNEHTRNTKAVRSLARFMSSTDRISLVSLVPLIV